MITLHIGIHILINKLINYILIILINYYIRDKKYLNTVKSIF